MSRQAYINGIKCVESWVHEKKYKPEQCKKVVEILKRLSEGEIPQVFENKPENINLIEAEEEDPLQELALGFYKEYWVNSKGKKIDNPYANKEADKMLNKLIDSDLYYVFGKPNVYT